MDSSMLGNGECRRYVLPFSTIPIVSRRREDGSIENYQESRRETFSSEDQPIKTCEQAQQATSTQAVADTSSENLTLLKFPSFQICLKSSDPRVPTKESKAEIEVCSKTVSNGTKTLLFLKVVFPGSGARFAAQVLPPWRSEAGIKMARMGGIAVLTKSPLDLHRRMGRVVKRRNQSCRK